MKLQNISSTNFTTLKPHQNISFKSFSHILNPLNTDSVSFKSNPSLSPEQKYKKASEFAQSLSGQDMLVLDDYKKQKLDGLQYGLKSFDNMSFEEVHFLMTHLYSITIPANRDCAGMCLLVI